MLYQSLKKTGWPSADIAAPRGERENRWQPPRWPRDHAAPERQRRDSFLLHRLHLLGRALAAGDIKSLDRAIEPTGDEELVGALHKRLGPLVYGEGDDGLPVVVGRLLKERGLRLAVAESCTGGLIAQQITSVPGSSEFFSGGVVAYSNSSKSALLGVSSDTLETHGAVSEPVARAMAEGVRERFGADLGLATTGISGPGGGSEEKPVGLVYVGLAAPEGVHCDEFVFALDRARHRALTAQVGLDWVRRSLLGFELVGPSLVRRGGASAPGSAGSPA